jgi:hypothetical protein
VLVEFALAVLLEQAQLLILLLELLLLKQLLLFQQLELSLLQLQLVLLLMRQFQLCLLMLHDFVQQCRTSSGSGTRGCRGKRLPQELVLQLQIRKAR